ncbi:MAG: hypothetical protein ACON4R_13730 [Akkermansiaceae bacterium]
MHLTKPIIAALLSGVSNGQFIAPDWRSSEQSEHAQWEVFTQANFTHNTPDISPDNATIVCTTSSAFLTSSGNIYSFQAPTYFQLDDSSPFPIENIVLQISALGSGIDLSGARLIYENSEGTTVSIPAFRHFILSQEELGGERGGLGTTYVLQWKPGNLPAGNTYSILFNATESSLSLDKVSLDTSSSFIPITKPKPLDIVRQGNQIIITWFGNWNLQTSKSLASGWTTIATSESGNSITLPMTSSSKFFRLVQPVASE